MTDEEIVAKLIDHAGGVKAFADACGVSRQSVWEWRNMLSDTARIRVFLYAEEAQIKLPRDFLRRAIA